MPGTTPEAVCKLLVLLYHGSGVEANFSAVDFNGIAKTLLGLIPEILSEQDFAQDKNRASETNFVHSFNDAVLAKDRTEQ